MEHLPTPDVGRALREHVRDHHGYDIATIYALHPKTLASEHRRIHENGIAKDHDHEAEA